MKRLLLLTLILLITFSNLNAFNIVPCDVPSQVGPCFKRGTTANDPIYLEKNIYKLDTIIPHRVFQELINNFRVDSTNSVNNLNEFQIAGFSFLPEATTADLGRGNIEFETTGLKIVLTLLKYKEERGIRLPSEIKLYGYTDTNELEEAMSISEIGGRRTTRDMSRFETIISNSRPELFSSRDSISYKSREFDLVFLDIVTYRDLATSTRFYTGGNRVGDGLTIKRAFITMHPNDDHDTLRHFRTLSFQPNPIPNETAYDSETALAFSYGDLCPPYWREKSFQEIVSQRMAKIIDKNSDDNDKSFDWFQFLLGLLSLFGLAFIVEKIRNMINGNETNEIIQDANKQR